MAKKAKRKPVKTHTFKLGRYHIDILDSVLYGSCDQPDNYYTLRMQIPNDNTLISLQTIVHECLHAEGVPTPKVHEDMGERIATLLWRLGWRKEEAE